MGEESKEGAKGLVAAIETEEEVFEQDADARRAVVALVAESEKNIWLAAVSDEEGSERCIWK